MSSCSQEWSESQDSSRILQRISVLQTQWPLWEADKCQWALVGAGGHCSEECWMESQRTQRCQVHYSCRKQQSGLQNEQKAALAAEPSNLVCWWEYPFCNLIPLQSHSKGKCNFPSPKRCRGDLPLRGLLGEEVAVPVKWFMEYECWSDRDFFH